ncbi:MAG: DUF4469 domain-containing protein [Treponema sp.]|jgi:hypothetical protein|nr:DUF4469 domain-containing protein [Treponema sp.]
MTNDIAEQLVTHEIDAYLYPIHLPGKAEGKYLAKTKSGTPLSVENVCAAAVERGGVTMPYEDLVRAVKAYLHEAAYQLTDGFAIENGYIGIYPKIGGAFDNPQAHINPEENRIEFGFRALKPLRDLADHVKIHLRGLADVGGHIYEVEDTFSGSINHFITPDEDVIITGDKIEIAGEDASCGVYWFNESGEFKVTHKLVKNSPSEIIARIPATLSVGTYQLKIRTQFSHKGVDLKNPREIISDALFEVQ